MHQDVEGVVGAMRLGGFEVLQEIEVRSTVWSHSHQFAIQRGTGGEMIGVLWTPGRHKIGGRGIPMLYKKVSVEVIVVADEAEAVVAELNAALDRLEESHTLFGGGIEAVSFEHSGKRRRSALAHTIGA